MVQDNNMEWIPASSPEKDSKLGEYDGFVKVLNTCSHIEFVGWYGFHPVYVLSDDSTVLQVRSFLQSKLSTGELSSSGRCMYVVSERGKPKQDTIELLLKVEDWTVDCIPNRLETEEEIRTYISKRENKMVEELVEEFSGEPIVVINRHLDFGGEYGQFQFIGVC